MLLFMNIDCVLDPPADAADPQSGSAVGVRRLEAVLLDWRQLRLVVTSDRRYRMTLEHFRGFLAAALRHRLIATTLLYGGHGHDTRRTREDEVLDWLRHEECEHADWLAVDRHVDDYAVHAHRLLACTTFTRRVVADLHARLSSRTGEVDTAVNVLGDALRSGSTYRVALNRTSSDVRPSTAPVH